MRKQPGSRGEYWRQLVREHEESGLPVRGFCRQARVNERFLMVMYDIAVERLHGSNQLGAATLERRTTATDSITSPESRV